MIFKPSAEVPFNDNRCQKCSKSGPNVLQNWPNIYPFPNMGDVILMQYLLCLSYIGLPLQVLETISKTPPQKVYRNKTKVATNDRQCAKWSPKWVPKCIPNSQKICLWGPHPPNGVPKWSFLSSRCILCVSRVPNWSPNRQKMHQKSYPEADKQKQTHRPTDQEKK